MKKAKLMLPFELEEIIFYDENGEVIEGIINVQSYKKGIVVATKNGLYTNVKSLLKKKAL